MPALVVASDTTSSPRQRWDEQAWWNSRPGGCKWMAVSQPLPATLRTPLVTPADILGDSLPPGTYYASVRLINANMVQTSPGVYTTVIDDQPVVPAGTLTVTR